MKFPRMDWYPWDFDEDPLVEHLTWQQKGHYMRVLMGMWKWAAEHDTVDLPDDDWQASGAVKIPYPDWVKLRRRLVDHPAAPLRHDPAAHVIFSPRLREEYAAAIARSRSYSERGKKGGRGHERHHEPKASEAEPNASVSTANLQQSYSFTSGQQQASTNQAGALDHLSLSTDQDQNQDQEIGIIGPNGTDVPSSHPSHHPSPRKAQTRSPESKALAQRLKSALEAQGVTVFAPDWMLKAQASAETVLRKITPAEAERLMDWALSHPFWSGRVTTMAQLVNVAPEWQKSRDSPGPVLRPKSTVADQNEALLRRRWQALEDEERGAMQHDES